MTLLKKIREKIARKPLMNMGGSNISTEHDVIKLKRQIERLDQRITDVSIIAGEIYLRNPNDLRIEGLYKKVERLSDLRNKLDDQLKENINITLN